jgi:FAD/FMN-containing dehydrogenase
MQRSVDWHTFPKLAGTLLIDYAHRVELGSNFGRHAAGVPVGVVQPATTSDVIKTVLWAREQGCALSARGQAHSTYTQTTVQDGILVDMRSLSSVLECTATDVWVQAGASWSEVLATTLPSGHVPPTLTDYQKLSVGGTLSVGGIGGETYRNGAQVDHVIELEVATGLGDLVRCSATEHPDLFDACRAGLGQFGIITSARLRLVPVGSYVTTVLLELPNLDGFLDQMDLIADQGTFHHLYGNITRRSIGGWLFQIVASSYGQSSGAVAPPDLRNVMSVKTTQASFLDFSGRIQAYLEQMHANGSWIMAHPWLDLFVPRSAAASIIGRELSQLEGERFGSADVLVYPLRRHVCSAPTLRLPTEEKFFLFDVLRNVPPAEHASRNFLGVNRTAYEQCVHQGGTLYPIGSMPMQAADWRRHFGDQFESLAAVKRRFDPDGILGRGVAAFG